MKKVLLSCGVAGMLLSAMDASAQLALQTFNAPTMPAGWLLYNVDGLTPNNNVSFVNNAWVVRTRNQNAGDSCITSTSWYTPAGTASDWIVTPQFTVNGATCCLRWQEYAQDAQFADGYRVLISTTGNQPSDFTTVVYSTTAASTEGFTTKVVNLGATHNGQTVRVAFQNNSNDKFLLNLDNIETVILPANAAELSAVSPSLGFPTAYGLAGSNITVQGVITNLGANNITGYTVNYQQGANPAVSYNVTGINILPVGTHQFTHGTPYVLPATVGEYPVKVWITLTGDTDLTDDTMSTAFGTAAYMPDKKLVFEEGTGTWCGWCPRGAAWMDSVSEMHGNDLTLIAVHNADPMSSFNASTQAYDTKLNGMIGGYPSMMIDRRIEADPSATFAAYNQLGSWFGFADISIGSITVGSNTISVPVTVKPAIDLNGDYRLALVITDEHVTGTGTGWPQTNYYSSQSQSIDLWQDGVNWKNLANPVPAANMEYEFVARYISNVDGNPGSLPAAMVANTNYNYNFTNVSTANMGTLSHLRVNILMLRNSDGAILNSQNTIVPTGVANVNNTISGVKLFPNPATERAMLAFTLQNAGEAKVIVTDAVGRVVYNNAQNYTSGEQILNINTSTFAPGLYNVTIESTEGTVSQRLSVVK
jgi:hypothetical protein